MSLRMYDFECSRGHRHEALVQPTMKGHRCPVCGWEAVRLIGAPRPVLDGTSGHFPNAADKWEKRRESHMAKERKNMERHGTYK